MSDENDFRSFGSPDWDANRVISRATQGKLAAVGDPARWGGLVTLPVTTPPLAGFANYVSPGFLRAQAGDGYGRVWSITGNLIAPAAYQIAALNEWQAELMVTQGVGQTTILQHFNLRQLCLIGQAGGYAGPIITDPARLGWAFAIMGGIVGQQWQAQFRVFIGGGGVLPAGDHEISVNAIAGVVAAGTGL